MVKPDDLSSVLLFAIRKASFISYFESLIVQMVQQGWHVHIVLPDSDKVNELKIPCIQNYPQRISILHYSPKQSRLQRGFITQIRELISYRNYFFYRDQSDFFAERWRGYLKSPLKQIFKIFIFRRLLKWFGKGLFKFEFWIKPEPEAVKYIKSYGVKYVLASPANMNSSYEIEFIKAAKLLGVLSGVPVLSWDNLTTKGTFSVKPDHLFVWNSQHAQYARKYHGFKQSQIHIVGAMFFDKWFTLNQSIAVKSEANHILYLGSSVNIAEDESWIVTALAESLPEFTILVRPHPAHLRPWNKQFPTNVKVWAEKEIFPNSEASQIAFLKSLRLAGFVVGINTSGLLDSIIVGRPTFVIKSEVYKRTQNSTLHFRELVQSDSIFIAENSKECAKQIRQVQISDEKAAIRTNFVNFFIRPHGSSILAGTLAANKIIQFTNKADPRFLTK